jgi:hypothetical protein
MDATIKTVLWLLLMTAFSGFFVHIYRVIRQGEKDMASSRPSEETSKTREELE